MAEISNNLRIMATQIPYIELGGFDLKEFADNLIKAAKRIEELQGHLREYGFHKNNCAYRKGLRGKSIEKCDCGFSKALEGKTI